MAPLHGASVWDTLQTPMITSYPADAPRSCNHDSGRVLLTDFIGLNVMGTIGWREWLNAFRGCTVEPGETGQLHGVGRNVHAVRGLKCVWADQCHIAVVAPEQIRAINAQAGITASISSRQGGFEISKPRDCSLRKHRPALFSLCALTPYY